jgi:hypothetical protein
MKVDAVLIDLSWFLNQNHGRKSWNFQSKMQNQITQPAKTVDLGATFQFYGVHCIAGFASSSSGV